MSGYGHVFLGASFKIVDIADTQIRCTRSFFFHKSPILDAQLRHSVFYPPYSSVGGSWYKLVVSKYRF